MDRIDPRQGKGVHRLGRRHDLEVAGRPVITNASALVEAVGRLDQRSFFQAQTRDVEPGDEACFVCQLGHVSMIASVGDALNQITFATGI